MQGFLLGLLFIGVGVAIIYRHRDLYKMFGEIERAQRAFGDSLILYPLLGAFLIVLGILFMFGIGGSSTDIQSQFVS